MREVSCSSQSGMKDPFRYFKYSPEVIRLSVMLSMSLRQVEDLLHERSIDVSHETICYWWNDRAENSLQPFRRKERSMQGFRGRATLQKFSTIHGQIYNHFNAQRHLTSRQHFKAVRTEALNTWRQLLA